MAQIAAEIGQGGKPKSRLEQLLEKARQTGGEATLTWEPGSAAAQKYNQRSVADTTGMVSAQGALEDEIRRAENPLGASGLRLPTVEDFDRAEEDKKQARKDFWKSLILDIGLTPDYSKPVAEAERQAAQQSSADLAKARERVTRAQDRYNALASSYQSEELRGFNALDASEDFARFSQGDAETAANNPNSAYYQIYHRNDEKTPEEPANDFARALLSVGKQAAGILPGTEAYAQMTTTPYAQMTDDEAARYFYLWHAEGEGKGPKAADAYLKLLEPKLNARANRINQQANAEFARSYPVLASAVSVPMNLAGGVMAMGDLIAQNIAQNNGSRKPIDYNTGYQQLGKTAQNYRSTIAEDLEKKYPKSILGGTLNLASFAYQTGMSMTDSGLQMLMLGGLTPDTLPYRLVENFGLLLLGGSAAQQSVYAAKERGANDAQALWTGIAAGVAEAFFEKVSVDNLVKNIVAKQGMSIGDKLTKDWLKGGYQTIAAWLINMGVQGGIEGMEEVATTLANTATDYNINKDRSEILTKVKEYQKQGMSEEDALNRALKEWGIGLFQDALGGAISGGIMGGAGTGAHLLSTGVSNVTQAAKTAWEQSKVQPAEETKAPAVEETPALEMPLPERQRDPLSYALDKIKNGGTVSNSDARAIMDNPQAMQALRDSGVLTDEGTTASEQRNAVKTAMRAYAEQQATQEAARAAQEERRPQEAGTTAVEETPRAEAQAAQQEAPSAEMPEIISRALDKINRGEEISLREAADLARDDPSMRILRDAGLLRGEDITYEDMLAALQEYAARQTSTRTESPSGLRLPVNQPLTQNRNENKITLTNNQEVTNNGQGQQAETADQRFIRLAAEQRGTVSDGSERGTRLGRFVENYRAQREYQNQERAGALLRSQAAARNLTWTSAEELGVANGSDEQTVRLLDDPSLNRTQRQTVSDYAVKGIKLQFVQGMMALNERTASGKQVLARAYISKDGKHIIVQADHPYLTWKQLLDHEEFHRQIKLDKDYKEQVEKAMLADSRIAPYLSDIIDRYTAAYKEMKPGITAEDILEEMLADYRAGFDMLASSRLETGNRSVTKAAAETIKKVEEQRSKAVQAAEKTGATVVPEKTAEQSTADITDAMADGDVGAAENFSYEAQSQALADRIREVYDEYSNDPEAIAREVLKLINESKQQESGEEGSYSSEIAERDVQEMEDNPDTFIDSSIGERVKYSYDPVGEQNFEPLRDEDGNIKYVYKAFYVMKDENGVGRLYPPMVSNVSDEEKKKVKGAVSGTQRNIYTPTGIVLTADVGMLGRYTKDTTDKQGKLHKAGELIRNTFGRLAVQNDKGGSGTLAFRPGWHLGEWPDAKQFNKDHPVYGKRSAMPDQLVFARCEIAGTVDYQLDAMRSGVGKNGKFIRTQAGLPRVPVNGYYKYRTNPDPDTAPWYITGQMRVVEILTDEQCREICAQYGVEMSPRMSGHDIDLAEYGLKPGPVERETDTDRFLKSDKSKANESDLEAALADPEYADAYKPGEIDFSDPEILKEFERNRQDAEYYRQQYEQKYGKTSIEIDADYMAAVESGDMETAQRMVDEAAKKAGYTIKAYHGTGSIFTVFDKAKVGSTYGTDEEGFFFSSSKDVAEDAASDAAYQTGGEEKIMESYLRMDDPLELSTKQNPANYYDNNQSGILQMMHDMNHDGIIIHGKDADMYVVMDSNQAKSADPVTYDDDGNPIPLSQRFNPEQEDIRYSIETDPDVAAQFSPEAIALREGRSGRRAGGKKKVSKVRSNTYAVSGLFNEVEAQMEEANEQNYTYNVESERETMNKALHRLETDFAGSVKKLSSGEVWDGTDVDTAMGILHQYRTEGRMTGDYTDFWNWSHEIQRRITKDAKALQAMDKYSRTGIGQAQKAAENLRKQYQLNPAQEAKVKKAAKDIMDGIDGDAEGAARDAVETAKGNKAPRDNAPALPKNVPDNSKELRAAQRRITSLQNKVTKLRQELSDLKKEYRRLDKENNRLKKQAQELKARMDAKQEELRQAQKELTKARRRIDRLEKQKENLKNQLDFEKQRRKDAERLLREASRMFEQMQQAEEAAKHGTPVKNWIPLTGEELAKRISARMEDPKAKTQTAMQTILSDLVKFAEEHALPERKMAEGQKRTAIDRITDYLNNRDAYGAAWGQAQSILRAQYADDVEKLSALEDFLGATISYNAEGTDRTMLDAILESADVLGISEKRILELASTGVTESTISRIGDELVDQVKGRMGTDYDDAYTQLLKDAARRHVNGIILAENMADQQLRLTRLTTDAARKLDTDLNRILTESCRTKTDAAQRIAAYLITELGIPSGDAAIAAQNIAGAFMDELAARADRRLQRMFAEKTPNTREQRDKLLDLLRLGGFTNANVEDAVADALGIGRLAREEQRRIMADMARFGETLDAMLDDDLDGLRNLIREQAAVRQTPLSPHAERVLEGTTDAEYLRDFALAQLASIAGDYTPRNEGARISTVQTISHLLNMRTALRNLTSNQVFDLVDSAANNLSMIPDMVLGAFTGKRTVGLDRSWTSRMKRQGAIEGAGRNLLEVRLDVSPNERQKSKYGTAGRRTNSMANSNAFRRILSHLEEVMGYELNTSDEFHKGSVRGETLESLARWVEQGYMTQEEANAFAEQEALYRSFQDDTLVGNIMGELKRLLNVIGFGNSGKTNSRGRPIHDFGLGDLVVKYTQVPGALIHRGIEYSPLGYAKMLYDLALSRDSLLRTQRSGENTNAAQRRVALDIGRATTGSGLITLFALLAKAGLLRRDDDDKDKNAKAMHAAQGLSGTQLNVTGLGRMIEGGDPTPQDGDVLVDIGFLEPLDSLMTIATLLAKEKEVNAATVGVKNLDGIWKAISNTSAMQTIGNIISTVQYHNDDDLPLYFQIPIEIASDSVSGFVPSPVRQLAQATDTTYRDQYRSKNVSDQVRAKVMNSIPGVRQQLAPKITPLGEDKKYQKPVLNYLNATLNPGNVNVYQSNRVVDELNRVYGETDDAKIWPERNAPYSLTANQQSYTLTPDERTQYQRTRGQETARIIGDVISSGWYKEMDVGQQADVLNWIGNFANDLAKREMLEARGIDYESKTYDKFYNALMSGSSPAEVVAEKYKKAVAVAEEVQEAKQTIAAAPIPEASKTEAEEMSPNEKILYAGFLKGGVSNATARDLAKTMNGSEATGHEQWREIYSAAPSAEREKAVTSVMTDDMQRNWKLAKNAGVSMDDYIKVRENYKDLDGNGKQKQAEWNATLDSMKFSSDSTKDKSIKGTLWQILTGSSSTKNNPYDKDAGQKVLDAKAKGGGSSGGLNAPARSPALKLPTVNNARRSSGLVLPTR